MINTDYNSIYNQYLRAGNMGKAGRTDKSHLSKNMEYLETLMAKADKANEQEKKAEDVEGSKKGDTKDLTQDDIRKLYAELNGISYGGYDEKGSYRQMAGTFLNEMVFSNMGSSKDLFVPQISRNVISAAFNTIYDYSDVEEKIRQMKETGDSASSSDSDIKEAE